MLDYQLSGRVALITGGTKGLGLAIARKLAQHGANVAICARGKEGLQSAEQELESKDARCIAVEADMTLPGDVTTFVSRTLQHFGRIDILVNNATASVQDHFLRLSDEAWQHHLNVKVLGYVRCARAVIPHMAERKWGRIINMAGGAARHVGKLRFTNGVTNAAIANLTCNLAREFAKDGITANTIHPAWVWTPRMEEALHREVEVLGYTFEEAKKRRLAELPMGRFIEPEEVADLVAFLCSPLAASISGQAIAVDGASEVAIQY